MPGWEMKIIAAEAERLIAMAAEDDDLRADLRALAVAILAATETPPPPAAVAPEGPTSEGVPGPPAARDEPDAAAMPTDEDEPLRELTLGRSRASPAGTRPVAGATTGPAVVVDEVDLDEIEARCRLKAEWARRAASRLRRMREGADPGAEVAPQDRAIAAWADRLADCVFWADSSDSSRTADVSLLDDVGGCFEAVAEASALVRGGVVGRPGRLGRTLPWLAAAQSALRAAIRRIGAPDDPDQLHAFDWLKATSARHGIYLKRSMRADDPADPTRWADLLARIERAGAGDEANRKGAAIEQPRSHRKPVRDEPGDEVGEARRLLRGRGVVLIGGIARPESKKMLEAALGLKELTWIETKEHQSIAAFEPAIARPDVALVLLAIRWSSHAFGDVKRYCDRHGKPMVRLPGGFGANQVASQILAQCSGKLEGD